MKKLFLSLSITMWLLTACIPQGIQVPQSPLLSKLEHKSGMIAYIGPDGNIYTSDQGGGHLKALTNDASIPNDQTGPFHVYQFPTWSHDGRQLAFVGYNGNGTEKASALYVSDVEGIASTKIYSDPNEAPFYLSWTPDNANIGFLSTTASGQSTILQSIPAQGGEATVWDTGAPYYWSWAPDGLTMVVHAGGGGPASAERVAFLAAHPEIKEDSIGLLPAPFQAPAWSPDGSHILVATQDNASGNSIVLTDAAGKVQKTLGTFSGEAAFAWSYDGQKVAYITSDQVIDTGLLGALHVLDLTTGKEIVQDRKIFAFFWSPNSEKIAYFVPFVSSATPTPQAGADGNANTSQDLLMQLNVLDVKTGENHEQFSFVPTQDFFRVLTFFDQYQQSSTIWSPDNNNLVLSFVDNQGKPGIVVAAASGQLQPRLLTQGLLAFWSWK